MSSRTLILKFFAAVTAMTTTLACSQQKFAIESETREFGQKVSYNTEVDILWIVDTSTSMDKYQSLLADQVDLFLGALNDTQLKFHMAVTTMDMGAGGEKGRFVSQAGTSRILSADTPDLANVLARRLEIGAMGSPVERGQEAMVAALSSAQNPTGWNHGFLRPDALLVVIFLSNEEDQSDDKKYQDFLDQIRPELPSGERSWIAHFMGVVPEDPNCKTSEWGYSSPGTRYMKLADASGGVAESICDLDLRRALTNVKKRILEVITEYPLDRKPIVSSIQVYVDGQIVPMDNENGWTYFAEKNSIRFHGSGVPKPDARIKVHFDPEGLK